MFFAVGLVIFVIYYGYYNQWALFFPAVISLCTILYLASLKMYLEEITPRLMRPNPSNDKNACSVSSDPQSHSLGSALLVADQLDERNAGIGDDASTY